MGCIFYGAEISRGTSNGHKGHDRASDRGTLNTHNNNNNKINKQLPNVLIAAELLVTPTSTAQTLFSTHNLFTRPRRGDPATRRMQPADQTCKLPLFVADICIQPKPPFGPMDNPSEVTVPKICKLCSLQAVAFPPRHTTAIVNSTDRPMRERPGL